LVLAGSSVADDGVLLQRIIELENRVAELERKLEPVLEAERLKDVVKLQKQIAHERAMMDAEFLSRNKLNAIEKAYHKANQDWKSDEAGNVVIYLTEKFPRANRTGCAVLTRAQAVEGAEQDRLLKQAIDKHSGCFYSNGVQVGPYAKLYLAMRLIKDGKADDAKKLFEDIRTNHPNAIDHKGQLLTSHLEGIE
jgi:hypothetical protein